MLLKVVDLRKTNYVTADDNVIKSISYDSEELFISHHLHASH